MELFAAGLSSLMSVFVLAVIVSGVMKLFQIHTVLTEIKDSLRSRSTSLAAAPYAAPAPPAAPTELHGMGSGDDMLRALDAQMKWDETTSSSETR